MSSRPRSQARLWFILAGLIACVAMTGMLVQRQSLLLPNAVALAQTVGPERELDEGPTPTPAQVVAPPDADAHVIAAARFFYADNFNTTQVQAYLDAQPGPLKDYRTQVGDRQHS